MNHLCQAHPIIGLTNKKNNFREAVVRCPLFWEDRGKSGHQRAGFPVKTGDACIKASKWPVPQKIYRLPWKVRVKWWSKSPPPQG